MKTTKSFLIVLFALSFAQMASAYYCPSTGRWLSRDQIGEPGFETLRATGVLPKVGQVTSPTSLAPGRWVNRDSSAARKEPNRYAVVGNNTPNQFDVLGLCGCNCGPDVTQAINILLNDVDKTFNNWSSGEQCSACAALYLNLASGWDINEFAPPSGYPGKGGCPCDNTFTYNGKCYYAGSLNYLLFGRANGLCGYPLFQALAVVAAWKTNPLGYGEDPDGVITQEAMDMTNEGYDGNSSPAGSRELGNCSPSNKKDNTPLSWSWGSHK